MMLRFFERDARSRVYGERALSGEAGRRLPPIDELVARLETDPAPLIVLKPLVESQHLRSLLDQLPEARAIWMLREPAAVASSCVARWPPQILRANVEAILGERNDHWCSESVSDETRRTVRRLWHDDASPLDAAALFWYARNVHYFQQGLDRDDRVLPCRYEDLLLEPARQAAVIYDFLGLDYPGDHVAGGIAPASRTTAALSSEIADLCSGLQRKFDSTVAGSGSSHRKGGGPWRGR